MGEQVTHNELRFLTEVREITQQIKELDDRLYNLCKAREKKLSNALQKQLQTIDSKTLKPKKTNSLDWKGSQDELREIQDFFIEEQFIDQKTEDFETEFDPHCHEGSVIFSLIRCRNVDQVLRCFYHLQNKNKITQKTLSKILPLHFIKVYSNGRQEELKTKSLNSQLSKIKKKILKETEPPAYINELFTRLKLRS